MVSARKELRNYTPQEKLYLEEMLGGFVSAYQGDLIKAMDHYAQADSIRAIGGNVSPSTQILRHFKGNPFGIPKAVPPTEDEVISIEFTDEDTEPTEDDVLKNQVIDRSRFRRNIERYHWTLNRHHVQNIPENLPHIMVMSTGRCGTVSLYHLFNKTQYVPHHSYIFNVPGSDRINMMCKMMDDQLPSQIDDHIANNWLTTRAAEWLGPASVGRPMIGMNHMDTIYAPVFAALHPEAKFIHLRRDPVKMFYSFYGKDQWNRSQLRPVEYTFKNGFRYHDVEMTLPQKIAWYAHFTEEFSRAMGDVFKNRYIEISSDSLFASSEHEIQRLLKFTNADISLDEAVDHFRKPVNVKSHKVIRDASEARNEFQDAYEEMLP